MYFHIWKYKNYTEGTFQEVEKHRKKPLRGHLKLKEGIIQQEQKTEVLYTNNTEVSQGHWLVNNTFCKAFNDISLHCTKSHYDWKKLQAVPNLSVQSWVNTAFSPGCLGHSQLGVQSWQGRKIPIWALFKRPAVLTGKTFIIFSSNPHVSYMTTTCCYLALCCSKELASSVLNNLLTGSVRLLRGGPKVLSFPGQPQLP